MVQKLDRAFSDVNNKVPQFGVSKKRIGYACAVVSYTCNNFVIKLIL